MNASSIKTSWYQAENLETGRLIFERLQNQPSFLDSLLHQLMIGNLDNADAVGFMVEAKQMVGDSGRWKEGHALFDRIRSRVLVEQHLGYPNRKNESLLLVCENITRVIYNLSQPNDPFDEDSGWWLIYGLHRYIREYQNGDYEPYWRMMEKQLSAEDKGKSN